MHQLPSTDQLGTMEYNRDGQRNKGSVRVTAPSKSENDSRKSARNFDRSAGSTKAGG